MNITHENIGDVLCLYSTAECVCITDIKGHHVYYDKEYGSSYMTTAQTADAFQVTDPERLALFTQNCALGKVLLNAELSAMNDLLSPDCSAQELVAARKSLDITHQHQHHLFTQIDAHRAESKAGKDNAKAYLSELMNDIGANVFWGVQVSLFHEPEGQDMFCINGHKLTYDQTAAYLGNIKYREPEHKPRLDKQIHSAHSRRNRNPFELESAHIYHHDR